MKKMPCLFQREFFGKSDFKILELVTPGCEWALAGEGTASVKWDGTACAIIGGLLYKRYDAKRDRKTGEFRVPPNGAVPCDDPDLVTGHWPHWVLVDETKPEDRWHAQAVGRMSRPDGTYELIGAAINGNPYDMPEGNILLVRHGGHQIMLERPYPQTFESIRAQLERTPTDEGIVFAHPDGRRCKIRRRDFGFDWPAKRPGVGRLL